ncbi:hypothetical protein VNI00_006553 [Paramarasmius palmivorus]|uniref:HTH TFE/IIEalpha-type domain-containing protein n=1 Tax=Paramarasmius palmivorus TaxID=297713 RepID=A0AAW0D7V6_9AGAR
MDQLARHPVLKDDDLASRMGLQPKELNKVIAVLSNDSLVRIYRQNELKEGAQRAVGKQYYYIDYAHFCNVVKWRIARMRHKIDSTLRNELDQKGYICTQCKQSYTPLDVDKLMDFTQGILICEICRAEVIDNENAESTQGNNDRMSRFNHQMRFILAGLKQSESMVLPPFDAATWIKTNLVQRDDGESSQAGSGLKIAGSGPSTARDDGIGVVISSDKDEATRRMERDAQAEIKRQQNALPAWHLKSTISGDLTALGVKENARAEAAAALQESISSSNDEILRGLGVVGARPANGTNGSQMPMEIEQDVKPTINHEADYYEQYYASLAASAAASAQATPSGLSAPGSSDFDNGEEEEEEDKKPSVEYLNSLNDYRKRSRSHEDEGSAGKTKLQKMNGNARVNGDGGGVSQKTSRPLTESTENGSQNGVAKASEDPLVYVNGNPKPFSTVTEEDHELMTPEEYTAFFEIMQSQEEAY